MRIAYLHGFLGGPEVWPSDDGIRIALPGHGGGPVLGTWAANVEAVARAMGSCDAVVGYSLGGRIAIALVAGGYVPRAVLISTNPGLAEHERSLRGASDAGWAALLRHRGIEAFVDAWEAQPLFATQARVAADRRGARRARRLTLDPDQLALVLEVLSPAQMPDYRREIDQRFRLIVGADDAKYVAIARGLAAHVTPIDGAGHDPLFEQPQRLIQSVADCLKADTF